MRSKINCQPPLECIGEKCGSPSDPDRLAGPDAWTADGFRLSIALIAGTRTSRLGRGFQPVRGWLLCNAPLEEVSR